MVRVSIPIKEKGCFGTLLDEPPTGLIFKKSTKIESIQDLVGKKIGYIGHFGKIMVR